MCLAGSASRRQKDAARVIEVSAAISLGQKQCFLGLSVLHSRGQNYRTLEREKSIRKHVMLFFLAWTVDGELNQRKDKRCGTEHRSLG